MVKLQQGSSIPSGIFVRRLSERMPIGACAPAGFHLPVSSIFLRRLNPSTSFVWQKMRLDINDKANLLRIEGGDKPFQGAGVWYSSRLPTSQWRGTGRSPILAGIAGVGTTISTKARKAMISPGRSNPQPVYQDPVILTLWNQWRTGETWIEQVTA